MHILSLIKHLLYQVVQHLQNSKLSVEMYSFRSSEQPQVRKPNKYAMRYVKIIKEDLPFVG